MQEASQSAIGVGVKYLDAHTHAQFAAYDADREAVIKRALSAGVGMINVGTQQDTSRAAVDLAHAYEGLYATVGLHPIHTSRSYHDPQELGEEGFTPLEAGRPEAVVAAPLAGRPLTGFTSRGEEFDYEYYRNLALDPKVVAIGECGLDYFRIRNYELGIKERQKKAFVEQIKVAYDVKKPLMVHCRSAFPDLIGTLIHNSKFLIPNRPGIIHFFSGNADDAKRLLGMGFYFTFGGVITFTRDYDEVIKMIPAERILSETDAPYVAPAPYRGKRNEPAYVVEVVKKLAALKNLSVETMTAQILKNAKQVFSASKINDIVSR